MKLNEAVAECERWLAYLQDQVTKARLMGQLATERRSGKCSLEDAHKRIVEINGYHSSPTVYDGGNLEVAVRFILKYLANSKKE